MTVDQHYLFDTCGHLIMPDAVSEVQLEELRAPLEVASLPARSRRMECELTALVEGMTRSSRPADVEPYPGEFDRKSGATLVDDDLSLLTFRINHTHVQQGFPVGILHCVWKGTGGSQFFHYQRSGEI